MTYQPTKRLEHIVAEAVARFDAMSETEKERRWVAFRRAYVIGAIAIEHPEIGRPYVERALDLAERKAA